MRRNTENRDLTGFAPVEMETFEPRPARAPRLFWFVLGVAVGAIASQLALWMRALS